MFLVSYYSSRRILPHQVPAPSSVGNISQIASAAREPEALLPSPYRMSFRSAVPRFRAAPLSMETPEKSAPRELRERLWIAVLQGARKCVQNHPHGGPGLLLYRWKATATHEGMRAHGVEFVRQKAGAPPSEEFLRCLATDLPNDMTFQPVASSGARPPSYYYEGNIELNIPTAPTSTFPADMLAATD